MRRFKNRLDADIAEEITAHSRTMAAIRSNMPAWRRELMDYKGGQRFKKAAAQKRQADDPDRRAREEVEREAAETVRKVVAALEMALTTINETPAPYNYHSLVNVQLLHDIVRSLRTKSLVKFGDQS